LNLPYINFNICAVDVSANIGICEEIARPFVMSPHNISNAKSSDLLRVELKSLVE
jgi:hypothetical protein